jgi:hypothetical protein
MVAVPCRVDAVVGAVDIQSGVSTGTGHISVLAGTTLSQSTGASDISTVGGTVDVKAGTGISMVDGALTSSGGGNVRYESVTGDITLGEINAGAGKVGVIALVGSILDLGGDTSVVDITASDLLLTAGTGIAASGDHLETTVANLTAKAGGGSMFLAETDGVVVRDVSVTVNRVKTDGLVDGSTVTDSQEDLATTGANGHIVLRSATGDITVTDAADVNVLGVSANGSGNILLDAVAGSIDIQAGIASGSGNISILANVNVSQSAAASDIGTTGGTLDISAATGSISMVDGSVSATGSGSIRYAAATTISLGGLSTTGHVSLSGTAITDGGDANVDVVSSTLMVRATTGFGTGSNHIETTVGTLSAEVGSGGLFVTEGDGVVVDTVAAVTVNRVKTDGTVAGSTVTDRP